MGNGIAQVFAQAGFDVRLHDASAPALDRARQARSRRASRKFVEKGKLTAGRSRRDAGAPRRSPTRSTRSPTVDFVVEAIVEARDAKRALFATLDRARRRRRRILASNTSSISITRARRGDDAPRPRARHALHEPGAADDAGRARSAARRRATRRWRPAMALTRALGKTGVEAADYPGFIANRILMPMINEAVFALMEGVGTRRGDRHGDEARDEPPDGPAHARRLHRPRRLPGDPRRAARRARRPEVPRRVRCSAGWSPPGTSDARSGRGFYSYA